MINNIVFFLFLIVESVYFQLSITWGDFFYSSFAFAQLFLQL